MDPIFLYKTLGELIKDDVWVMLQDYIMDKQARKNRLLFNWLNLK